jgi:pimeloyl-ACP methyl ester carboxylesterase
LIIGYRLHGAAWPRVFVERLAERFSIITYDSRGTGLSDKPRHDYAIPTMAKDVAGVIAALGSGNAHVLGFSMGGAVAQELAIGHPERVKRLILFATFAGLGFTIPAPGWVQRRLFDVKGLPPEEAAKQVWPVTYTPQYLHQYRSAVEAQMREEIAHPTPDHVARGQRAGLRIFSSGLRLWRVSASTLVATGANDQVVPPSNSKVLAAAIPRARLEILSGLGHRAIWEAPVEMAHMVIDFLTIPDSAAASQTSKRSP